MYTYHVLDTRPQSREAQLAQITSVPSLGVEVTEPWFAEACSLGNIDPQHTAGGAADQTAIEAALIAVLPPVGAQLVTTREDMDVRGAWAVLTLRAEGMEDRITHDRLQRIAAKDRFDNGPWQHRSLREEDIDWEIRGLGALVSNFKIPIEDRVALVREWLLGEEPMGLLEAIETAKNTWRTALEESTVRVIVPGLLVAVASSHRFAMELGYAHAPVVIASNPAMPQQGGDPYLKHTVAQWPTAAMLDLGAVLAALKAREAGWGGNVAGGIIGSPFGASSVLTTDQVVALVREHLTAS